MKMENGVVLSIIREDDQMSFNIREKVDMEVLASFIITAMNEKNEIRSLILASAAGYLGHISAFNPDFAEKIKKSMEKVTNTYAEIAKEHTELITKPKPSC